MLKELKSQEIEIWRQFLLVNSVLLDRIDRSLREMDALPLDWYDVLVELALVPERRLRMYDLAERVVLSRSGLTRLIDRLEKNGLLMREPDPADRRGLYAVLTEKGLDALRQAWPIYATGIQGYFLDQMDESELSVLGELLSRMLKVLQKPE